MLSRRTFLSAAAAASAAPLFAGRPAPFGALPSERQLAWHKLETTAFLHFSLNTFTDKEWGYGDEDPNLFQPAKFDPDAIVEALAAAGMRGVILTAKHHDGFCLWPTKTTERSVKASSWRNGQGDVVRDLAAAAKRHNLKFGVYLSPWDRNNAAYGTPAYIDIYRRQLTELLTNYGPIFEVWHDGANGGDGYYGGAREKRTIDKHTYYDWPTTWDMIRKLQPEAVIFSDVGPDIRWVGNERGIAGDPCWATYDPVGANGGPASPGDVREKDSPTGTKHGTKWLPAECDVSIRRGWFWHESETARVKTPEQLKALYYQSTGRGANFLLNVPPNRDGLIDAPDTASLKTYGDYLRKTFGKPVAQASAKQLAKAEPEIDLPRDAKFSVIRVREDIALGQRVEAIAVESFDSGEWKPLASATSVGPRRIIRLDSPVGAAKVRLRVTQTAAPPVISEFAVFSEA
ncbi:MAG TPA: alpha-L-fucosidase [Bryobacteraceae bacterium]|nr:alpha-L-fucosidase [Bryobacteraceae bacterium]